MTPALRPDPVLGAVLAGGRASRMGRPKEGVLLEDGRAMIEPVIEAMAGAFGRVIVVGNCAGFDCGARPEIVHLQDLRPGLGPLAGLESLLASDLASGYVVAACDQPLLSSSLLQRLAEGAGEKPRFFIAAGMSTHLDPLPGYFPASLLSRVRSALEEGRRSFRDLVRSAEPEWIPLPDALLPRLKSINSPEDLAALSPEGASRA
jgi:molybdenum cofactor guanylyltransferase